MATLNADIMRAIAARFSGANARRQAEIIDAVRPQTAIGTASTGTNGPALMPSFHGQCRR